MALQDAEYKAVVDLVITMHQNIACSRHGNHKRQTLAVQIPGFRQYDKNPLIVLWFGQGLAGDNEYTCRIKAMSSRTTIMDMEYRYATGIDGCTKKARRTPDERR